MTKGGSSREQWHIIIPYLNENVKEKLSKYIFIQFIHHEKVLFLGVCPLPALY